MILDAARSNLSWSHWEQGATGTQAVFRYAIPPANSHYRVNYCCVPSLDPAYPPAPFDRVVGYHGEIAIAPDQGSILRLTVVADLKPTDPVSSAGIMVEYGPVDIGGQSYICPTRSVAYSVALSSITDSVGGVHSHQDLVTLGPPQKLLNDVAFDQYHMFRSDVRILSGDDANQQEHSPVSPPPASANEVAQAPAPKQESEHRVRLLLWTIQFVRRPNRVPPSLRWSPPAGPTPGVPATETRQESPSDQVPVFKTTTREVVVDVVVTKGNGDAVPGLSKQDFEVSEDGKPQTVDFFQEHSGNAPPGTPPEMPVMPAGMRTNVPPAPLSDAVNVLLIDTLNTGLQDQAFVRKSVLEFLGKMQPGTRMAIFALGSKLRCIQGFTTDSSALLAALNDSSNGLSGKKSAYLKTSSDQADDAGNVAALQAMGASGFAIGALQAAFADTGAQDWGVRASMTFQALMYLGHQLAGIPGRKNLIWFAGSFPIAIFPTADQLAHMKQNPALPGYVDHVKMTADLFTVSQIAVYPISAEGLMSDHFGDADAVSPVPSATGIGHIGNHAADDVMSPYMASAGGRAGAIYAMEQLAASTGGKAFYNTNDLGAALKRVVNDGANYYTVGYSPTDAKMDGSFRQIDVKLAHQRFKLAYRHGYNADAGPASDSQSSVDPLAALLQPGLPGVTTVLYGASAKPVTAQPSSGEPPPGKTPTSKARSHATKLSL